MNTFPDDININVDKEIHYENILREELTKKIRVSEGKINFIIRTCKCDKCRLNMLEEVYDIYCNINIKTVSKIVKELQSRGYSVDIFNSKCDNFYYVSYGLIELNIKIDSK